MYTISENLKNQYPEFADLVSHMGGNTNVWFDTATVCRLLEIDADTFTSADEWPTCDLVDLDRLCNCSGHGDRFRRFVHQLMVENDEAFKNSTEEEKSDAVDAKIYRTLYIYSERPPNEVARALRSGKGHPVQDDRILSVSFLKLRRKEVGTVRVPIGSTVNTIACALRDCALEYRSNRYYTSFNDLLTTLVPK